MFTDHVCPFILATNPYHALMTSLTARWFALLLVIAPSLTLAAPPPKQYLIELIVFQNTDVDPSSEEQWATDYALNLERLALADVPKATLPSDSRLNSAAAALNKAGYRTLATAAWVQGPFDAQTSVPNRIKAGDSAQGGVWLDGSARFYVSRFLHLELELVFSDGTTTTIPDPNFKAAPVEQGVEPIAPPLLTKPLLFVIKEQRRIKTLENYYFDHPRFGVIARVTPVGAPPKR